MRKYLPFVLSAFVACSYAAASAAADPSASVDPVKRDQPVSGADAKGDANPAAPTASDNARPEKRSSSAAGGTQDSSQTPKAKTKKPVRKDRER